MARKYEREVLISLHEYGKRHGFEALTPKGHLLIDFGGKRLKIGRI